ncbi:cation/H(+) antiporter 15-like [Vicia villosa]|uniref:cation/H(+) antiporter 15-like n=1 Tax=Vicia villosa TaxID=3911 RepID=UPI00273CDFAC|nr:cation/H(+) antiporter 15-like [Vicia villosa]
METSRGNGTVSVSFDAHGLLEVCVKNDRNVGSYGIFLGDNPFDFALPATLFQLIVIITISQTLYFLLRPLQTPKFICSVLGGILLGPSFLGRNEIYWKALFPARQADVLVVMSMIGVIYFLFFIAIKMDLLMTVRAAKSTWWLGIIPFMASFIVMSTLINVFYLPQNFANLKLETSRSALSATMSFSNFPVVSEALIELNLIATELGQIALSSATLNDCIQFFIIVSHHLMDTGKVKYLVLGTLSWVLFMLFSFYILGPVMKMIAHSTPTGKPVKRIFVVFILLGALVMAGITDTIGVTFIIGPLIYGLVIPSGPPLGTTLVEKCEVIILEFLLPFFFADVGMTTNLTALHSWKEFVTLQLILSAGDLAKVIACVLVSMTYNIKPKHGTVLGLMLNIKGITHLIALSKLRKLKILDDETFSHLVISVVVTTGFITPIITILYKHRPRALKSSHIYDGQMRTIQNSSRNSELRIITCLHNEGNVRGITTLLEVCNPVPASPLGVYVIHLIELLGKSAPILLPINYRRNKKLLSVNYPDTNHIMQAFENYSNNSSGPVIVLPYVNVAPYRSMHDAVVNLAQDKMAALIIVPFHENDHIDLTGHISTSIRKLNTRFQAHVPCTLGILVDRYSRLGVRNDHTKPYFHVGVFFVGGPDDREALALGIRMSDRENMKVSLFRFIVMNKKERQIKSLSGREIPPSEQEQEEMLDEGLIDEFKSMKFGMGNVSWYEVAVEDTVEVMSAIRGLEGNYDLVMVGKRHTIGSLKDEEMGNFIENVQILGIFGDMLSSTEFCIGTVPVLVTQCGGDKRAMRLDRVGSANVSEKSVTNVSQKSLNVNK